jgi:hypothetical protein
MKGSSLLMLTSCGSMFWEVTVITDVDHVPLGSVADPGSEFFPSRIRIVIIPDPGSGSWFFTHPGSRIRNTAPGAGTYAVHISGSNCPVYLNVRQRKLSLDCPHHTADSADTGSLPKRNFTWPSQITSNKPSPAVVTLQLCTNRGIWNC